MFLAINPDMAKVENGRIQFSGEEFKKAKGFCSECSLANVCGGLDSKITGADIHPNCVEDPTDQDIYESAVCLKQIKV